MSINNITLKLVTTLAISAASLLPLLAGCQPLPDPVSRQALLSAHNDNAYRIDALWAVADVELSFMPLGPIGKIRLTDGRLYYRRNDADPAGAPYIILRAKEAGVEVFQLGTDPVKGEFYCWIAPPNEQPWAIVGKLSDLQTVESDSLAAIDPVNLAAAIGIVPWPADPALPQQAVIKTCEAPDIYRVMVVGNVENWGGWALLREEWIDRRDETLRPYQIHIFDRFGRDTMRADIDNYGPIEDSESETQKISPPMMATDVTIYPPEKTGIRWMRLRISGQTTGNAEQTPPPARAFRTRIPPYIRDIRAISTGQ